MLHLPTPMLMGAPQGKTYAEFEAWALTQGAAIGASGQIGGAGLGHIALGSSFSGNMYGSPWGSGPPSYGAVSLDSISNRVALHSFLTIEDANANLGRMVVVRLFKNGSNVFFAQNRNGYTSLPYSTPDSSVRVERFDYFNDLTGRIKRVNPYEQTWSEVDF